MTGNPTLSERAFTDENIITGSRTMTVQGTVNKTMILLLLAGGTATYTWNLATTNPSSAGAFAIGGAIGGLIMALITMFKKEWCPVTAPIYALLEGLFLGAISAMYNAQSQGIALQAVMLTFGTLAALLFAYTTGIIRATPAFTRGVIAATGGIAIFYLVSMVLSLFGINLEVLSGGGLFGIGLSLVIVVVAALNLILDFASIEGGAKSGAPKYMEWYGAFGLLVTLVWLYLEMLRLLSKLNRRN